MARTTTAPTRHRTPSLEVETSVVDAALRIIRSTGADALTVRGLATEAGVAPMTIYNRFGDMHGVLDALLGHGFSRFAEALELAVTGLDPMDDLLEMGRSYRRFAIDEPELYSFMFLRPPHGIEPSDDTMVAAARSFDALGSVVQRAIDLGRMRAEDPDVLAQAIWASCHGAVALELLEMCEFADAGATYEVLLANTIRGLHPPRASE